MPNSDFSSFLRHRFSYVVRIVELLRTPTISMRQWTLIQSILLYFYFIFYFNIGDFYIKKNNGTRATLFARIIKIKRTFTIRVKIYMKKRRVERILERSYRREAC